MIRGGKKPQGTEVGRLEKKYGRRLTEKKGKVLYSSV